MIGYILGLYRGYIAIMEKKMETIGIIGGTPNFGKLPYPNVMLRPEDGATCCGGKI